MAVLLAAVTSVSADAAGARQPKGIYAVVVLDETRGAGTADFDVLVSNPAVSGLAVRVFWSALQPAKERYDFSPLDAAFAARRRRTRPCSSSWFPASARRRGSSVRSRRATTSCPHDGYRRPRG